MQELSWLFGSVEKVKIIRFFLANPDGLYDTDEIEERLKIKKEKIRDDLLSLEKAEMIIKSKERFSVEYSVGTAVRSGVKEYICYKFNKDFRFAESLNGLMFDFKNADREVLMDKFRTIGRCKLLILAGEFIESDKSRLDILYVGEAIKTNLAEKVVSEINIEVGKKLNIHVIDIEEFRYRYNMFDRFLRDVLSESNEVLINKLKGI